MMRTKTTIKQFLNKIINDDDIYGKTVVRLYNGLKIHLDEDTYVEDITRVEFLKLIRLGKKTWLLFIKLRRKYKK